MNFFDLFKKKPVQPTATDGNKGNKETIGTHGEPDHIETPQQEPPIQPAPKDGKAHIYNLIIIDESGSMSRLRDATQSGVNETIGTIRQAQQDYADKQSHFLTLVTFDSPGPMGHAVRTIIDTQPIGEVQDFTDYHPCGNTPLFDAMGQSISRLHRIIKEDEDATAIVTVMTDGLENASREYSAKQLKALIEQLKEEGWTFNYMGSAHDVHSVCDLLSIENVVEFSHDEAGTHETWRKERMSKSRMFAKLDTDWESMSVMSAEEKRAYRKKNSKGYFDGV